MPTCRRWLSYIGQWSVIVFTPEAPPSPFFCSWTDVQHLQQLLKLVTTPLKTKTACPEGWDTAIWPDMRGKENKWEKWHIKRKEKIHTLITLLQHLTKWEEASPHCFLSAACEVYSVPQFLHQRRGELLFPVARGFIAFPFLPSPLPAEEPHLLTHSSHESGSCPFLKT